MVNGRQKGNNAEIKVAEMLHRYTGEAFVQTPGSGSGKIKGDLMVGPKENLFAIEVKFYRDMSFNHKMFTQKRMANQNLHKSTKKRLLRWCVCIILISAPLPLMDARKISMPSANVGTAVVRLFQKPL